MSKASPAPRTDGIDILAEIPTRFARVLTPAALDFAAGLERATRARRHELLAARRERQARLDAGERPDFLAATRAVRDGDWRIAETPAEIACRRVEITGSVDRKMIVNALNSGANVFMADFEDATSPTWHNVVDGQLDLRDAVRRQIDFTHEPTGKRYALADDVAMLFVRPRGWHLPERHVQVDGAPMSASLFDFALFFFHNARELLDRGQRGVYFYLPKLESHLEARLWNDVFVAAQDALGIPRGAIKATVLIETILAAFEMDEILFELRDHSAGLNCGRWDYIFSFIKKLRARPDCVLPDRGQVGMDRPFLRAYSELLIRTCHRRGAHAMGGMAAQIPIKNDPERNERALAKVRADKRREVEAGHDGTWVAHPGLIEVARAEFDRVMTGPNQLARTRDDVRVTRDNLLRAPDGTITEHGLRQNLEVGVTYLAAWLSGTGCVPIHDLMEDAATAEISRTQVWQWLRHGARLEDGRPIDRALVRAILDQELRGIEASIGTAQFRDGRFALARDLFSELTMADELADFLTLAAYEHI